MPASLKTYQTKRNFKQTREPTGQRLRSSHKSRSLHFVVQKHDATRLHYDFRLEMDGVLKSWAVPKGVPRDKGESRLAMEVEDHPIEYGKFEGTIPPGNYGAGTVQLWDRGKYEVAGSTPTEAWRKGKLSLVLHGKKLAGHWTLVRTRNDDRDKIAWLLIKTGESLPHMPAKKLDVSVSSGKTLAELSRSRRAWRSSRSAASAPAPGTFKARIQSLVARKRRA